MRHSAKYLDRGLASSRGVQESPRESAIRIVAHRAQDRCGRNFGGRLSCRYHLGRGSCRGIRRAPKANSRNSHLLPLQARSEDLVRRILYARQGSRPIVSTNRSTQNPESGSVPSACPGVFPDQSDRAVRKTTQALGESRQGLSDDPHRSQETVRDLSVWHGLCGFQDQDTVRLSSRRFQAQESFCRLGADQLALRRPDDLKLPLPHGVHDALSCLYFKR